MEKEKIDKLLEKYYDGKTDDHEEAALMDYFASANVPDRLQTDRRLFEQLYGTAAHTSPGRMAERMAHQIDSWNTVEHITARRSRTVSLRWAAGIAASLLLVCTVGIGLHHSSGDSLSARQDNPYEYKDTYDNPEQAYAMTETALIKFSRSLNKGLRSMENQK